MQATRQLEVQFLWNAKYHRAFTSVRYNSFDYEDVSLSCMAYLVVWSSCIVCLQSVVVCGTIPYLGTFLTDLTMVDTAMDDKVNTGLVNFDKRRKEFEILAQIKLLQSSAQLYDLKADTAFLAWFFQLRVYDDKERWVD